MFDEGISPNLCDAHRHSVADVDAAGSAFALDVVAIDLSAYVVGD
jgi:nanoRNase/pAp phosphatase (c-di-AMP/oligoRNAs hydrolase)